MRILSASRLLFIVLLSVFIAIIFSGCHDTTNNAITVKEAMIKVGNAYVGDSVCATFHFRNNTLSPILLTFIPECDCTIVSADSIIVGMHKRVKIKIKVDVKAPGEFYNHVYVQSLSNDDFITVTITGFGILKNEKRSLLSRYPHFGL